MYKYISKFCTYFNKLFKSTKCTVFFTYTIIKYYLLKTIGIINYSQCFISYSISVDYNLFYK